MNGPDAHREADPVEELLDGIEPGLPLAGEVERHLNERGGPVPVDEERVRAAARSVQARIRGQRQGRAWPVGRVAALLAAAAAVFLVGVSVSMYGERPRPPHALDGPQAAQREPAAPLGGVEIRTGSNVRVRHDTVFLYEGVVSVSHDAAAGEGAHAVRLPGLAVDVEPVGTVFHTGVLEDVAAVWVEEGAVRLVHDRQGDLGEVGPGRWALLTRLTGAEGLEVQRLGEEAVDPVALGLDESTARLLAEMRWMALPEEAREGILGAP